MLMYGKYEKICGVALFLLLCVTLVPVMYLGRYNHPTGDDYYYGAETRRVWEETGNIAAVLGEAGRGAAEQYVSWQGTYSAMFLMYLPPNLWGEGGYGLVTAVMLLLYAAAVFYFLHPILCKWLGGSVLLWLGTASAFVLLTIQTVPFQGESFFWYNGSMYYTGFFSVSLLFFGMLIRYLIRPRKYRAVTLAVLAVFLAGGNYVSLLPSLLILATVTIYLVWKRSAKAPCVGAVTALMLAGLIVSMVAPGNRVRESGLWEMSAGRAVLQSLLQGGRYVDAWMGKWWLMTAAVLTPLFWNTYQRVSLSFRYPVLVSGYLFGVFCSMSCPLYYAQGTSGPARALAVIYYAFMLFSLAGYYYLLGAFFRGTRSWRKNGEDVREEILREAGGPAGQQGPCGRGGFCMKTGGGIFAAVLLCLGLMQLVSGKVTECTSVKALRLLWNGEAAAYQEEYLERMELLRNPELSDVMFTPYEHQPDMLYVGDFPGDPLDPTAVRVAEYFHKDSVWVDYSRRE